jgi:uncharacterized membrane protein
MLPFRPASGVIVMALFSTLDLLAVGWFVGAWAAYSLILDQTALGRRGLTALMHRYREVWMDRMIARQNRIVDAQITAALQNGTAFFASTSLLAIGGALTLVRSTDSVLGVVAEMPFGIQTTRALWEAKAFGLAIIFVYAFFKFAWAYRLFNYVAIMLGATPPDAEKGSHEAKMHARRTAGLIEEAGRHFNRGQRAFFLALGYLGWFISPVVFMASTAAVLAVLARRQFASRARRAVGDDHDVSG